MDYEEKYKEALERARHLHKDAIDMGENLRAKQCEIIFPELCEQRDEKIRKDLIRFVKGYIRDETSEQRIAYLDWIEKQGYQKPQRIISAEAKEAMYDKPTWSEEDEEMVNNIIDYMKPMPIFFESTKGKSGKEYTKEFVKEAIKWLKFIKERLKGE